MSLNLDTLAKWRPYGFLDSELGYIAVFALSVGAEQNLEISTRRLDDPIEFARHLARYACFPSEKLRDGKYRPKEPVFCIEEISTLSDTSLAQIARFFIKDNPGDYADPLDTKQLLNLLMTQFRDDWKSSLKIIQDALSPFRGLGDGFFAIDSQIKILNAGITGRSGSTFQKIMGSSFEINRANINLNGAMNDIVKLQSSRWEMLADAASDLEEIREGIKDTTKALQEVAAIQEAMNAQNQRQVEAEELQRLITRGQNRLVLLMTGITLAATIFIGPVSRLVCAASTKARIFSPIPALETAAKITCGL